MTAPSVSDTWERGSPYETYIGRWSRRVAPMFLDWLQPAPGARWLDVGCGTGALCAAIIDRCAPGHVYGVEPSEGFLALAAAHLGDRATLLAGHAAALPLADASVDRVVSGLVLNFVDDLPAAIAEMARVARPGATLSAYVWDYAEGMELIRLFWDAAVALDPAAQPLHEGARFPLCRPQALSAAFAAGGLRDVQVVGLDAAAGFDDFEAYWQPFLGGQGPAPAYLMSLPEDRRERLRQALRERLAPSGDGPIRLNTRAWAVRATTPLAA